MPPPFCPVSPSPIEGEGNHRRPAAPGIPRSRRSACSRPLTHREGAWIPRCARNDVNVQSPNEVLRRLSLV